MSRRMTRSRSRSLLRESSEKSQTSKQPKSLNKLTSISESSHSSSKITKNKFQYYVQSMRDFIKSIENLKDTTADIVAFNFERLSQTCDKMKQDMKVSNKHLTDDTVNIEMLNIIEFAFLEFAGEKIDFGKSNTIDHNGTESNHRKKKKRKVTKRNIVEEKQSDILSWLPGIFSLALKCAISSIVAGRVPFVLLDSVLNTQTIDVCESIWDLVESLSEQISHETLVPADGRNISSKLWLLRLANTLLKRLSTTQNSFFCGRISLFLARIFPLSEKSALNLSKKRNTANTTLYDSEEIFNSEVDNSSNDSATKILYASYTNFWRLQHDFFRDPTNVLRGPTPRRQFLQAVDDVLQLFADNPLPQEKDGLDKSSDGANTRMTTGIISDNDEEFGVHKFTAVKYLTTSRLFRLQLIDPQLRRHVFCQILIVLVEIIYSGSALKNSEFEKIAKCQKHVLTLLAAIDPNGKTFANGVFETLKGCVKWKIWKYNEKCPSYEKYPDPKDEEERTQDKKNMLIVINDAKDKAVRNGSKDAIAQRRAKAGMTVQPALKRFWTDSETNGSGFNLTAHCALNDEIQDLKHWYEQVIDAEDPINGIEDIYHPRHDKVYSWKSLRLTASKQFNTFNQLNDGSIVRAAEHLGFIDKKEPDGDDYDDDDHEGEQGEKKKKRKI